MKTPEERAEMVRQQVISKIHWGARQQEVTDWLQEQHGIVATEAEELLADAYRARRKAVRERALIRLVLSAVGIALVGAFFYVRFFSGPIFYYSRSLIATVFAFGVGAFSVSTLVRSLVRLITGETPGSVD
jgi:hypothetical protein